MELPHTFAGNPLDRADALRREPQLLEAARRDPASRYLPFHNLQVLIGAAPSLELGWLDQAAVASLNSTAPLILLGLLDETPHFAIDLSDIEDPLQRLDLGAGWRFMDARGAAMELPAADTGILAQSRSQVDWHRRHGFCSTCGAATTSHKGGHVRRCSACAAEHFPRTDPVAIMLIVDGDRCLLGQSAGRLARTGMYSALAGFIDQGESIEEAVRREIQEEAGVTVAEVIYHSSQPWPFPSSLMIGCHGRAASTAINMDTKEMADVRWFDREVVADALKGEHATLRLPGPIAIAHHLIRAWVAGEVEV